MHEPVTPNVRPATEDEAADVPAMHAANRAAWDEAAERYEGWFDEAVALIRSGGSNLFPVEPSSSGTCTAAAGGRSICSAPAGATRCRCGTSARTRWSGVDFSPRMLDLAARLTEATGAPARWIVADVLETPHDLDGTADLLYTGRGAILWLQDLDAWAAVLRRLLAPAGRLVIFDGAPGRVAVRRRRGRPLDRHRLRLLRRARGLEAAGRPSTSTACRSPRTTSTWKFARAWTLGEILTALIGAGLRLERVAEHPVDWWWGHAGRPSGGARPDPAVVLGRGDAGATDGDRPEPDDPLALDAGRDAADGLRGRRPARPRGSAALPTGRSSGQPTRAEMAARIDGAGAGRRARLRRAPGPARPRRPAVRRPFRPSAVLRLHPGRRDLAGRAGRPDRRRDEHRRGGVARGGRAEPARAHGPRLVPRLDRVPGRRRRACSCRAGPRPT